MHNNILFGIVIPTYNRMELLKRAVESVQKQTYDNWLICIVDDHSKDATKTLLNQYDKEPQIHYIQQASNQGVNAARNIALDYLINEKNCDFITFLDDDDYFDTNTLLEAQEIIQKNPTKNWYVSKRIDDRDNDITRIDNFGVIPYIDYYLGITMDHDATHVVSSSLIENTRFSTQFKQAQEWIFFMELSTKSDMFTYDFPSTICTYLDDGLSAHAKQLKYKKSDQDIAVEKLKKETLKQLGYKSATIEVMKLQHRILQSIQTKKYSKLLRYIPRYLYWKLRESV